MLGAIRFVVAGWLAVGTQIAGAGPITFQPMVTLFGTTPRHLLAADFDGNGSADLAVTDGSVVSVFLTDGAGSFQPDLNFETGTTPTDLGAANVDLDPEGRIDLYVADGVASVRLLLNQGTEGDLSFTNDEGFWDITPGVFAAGFLPADGIGAFAGIQDGGVLPIDEVDSRAGDGSGGYPGFDFSESAGDEAVDVLIADFDGDRHDDALIVNSGSDSLTILLYQAAVFPGGVCWEGTDSGVRDCPGTGTNPPDVAVPDLDQPIAAVTGQFTNDTIVDIAVVNGGDGLVRVLQGLGDGTFIVVDSENPGAGASAIAAGDLDQDGMVDLAVGTNAGVTILRNQGDSDFAASGGITLNGAPSSIVVTELSGDALPDIAVTLGNGISVFENVPSDCDADIDGSGAVTVADLVLVVLAWGTADRAADVTGDGSVDVEDLVQVILQWGPC